jgi:hypothetical protein
MENPDYNDVFINFVVIKQNSSWLKSYLIKIKHFSQTKIDLENAIRGHSNNTWQFSALFRPSPPPSTLLCVTWQRLLLTFTSEITNKKMSRDIFAKTPPPPCDFCWQFGKPTPSPLECHVLFEWPLYVCWKQVWLSFSFL